MKKIIQILLLAVVIMMAIIVSAQGQADKKVKPVLEEEKIFCLEGSGSSQIWIRSL